MKIWNPSIHKCGLLTAITVLISVQGIRAQNPVLSRGDRIKVLAPSVYRGSLIGEVGQLTPEVLTVITEDTTYYLVYSSVEMLSVYTGSKRKTGKGMLIGAALGAAVVGGFFVANQGSREGSCEEEDCPNFQIFSDTQAFLVGAAIGAFSGAAIGAVMTALSNPPEWRNVPVRVAFGLQPAPQADYFPVASGRLHPSLTIRLSLKPKR